MSRRTIRAGMALFAVAALMGTLPVRASLLRGVGAGTGVAPAVAMAQESEAPVQPHSTAYVIGDDDILEINVWKEPDLTRSIPVRSDGKISLPLVGEIQAAGLTPLQLEENITSRLKSYITAPEVTVMVQKINSEKFNVMGQVVKPGAYPLTATMTIIDAIATAGGLRDFAKKKDIYVLRQGPAGHEQRLRFNYKSFIKGKNSAQNVRLRPGDTVVVP